MEELKKQIPNACGIRTRERDSKHEFSGYPRGMKNEVMAHYQQGWYEGALWAIEQMSVAQHP